MLTAFGVVTNDNLPFFVPFNETTPPFPNGVNSSVSTLQKRIDAVNGGVTNTEQNTMYTTWIQAAAQQGVSVNFDQWSQSGLTTNQGSTVSQPNEETTDSTTNEETTGSSPNDGYAYTAPTGSDVQDVLTSLTSLFG